MWSISWNKGLTGWRWCCRMAPGAGWRPRIWNVWLNNNYIREDKVMKPLIFVTKRIPQPALDRLAEVFELRLNPQDKALSKQQLCEAVGNADALLCLLTDSIDRDVLSAGTRLKCVSNYAVGFNNIDVEFATQRGIAVCNTPGVLTESTADLTWALIMSSARRIVESDNYLRAGSFTGWEPMLMLGHDVFAKTLGIVGMGRIGQAVARRAAGFSMRVLYHDPAADAASLPAEWQAATLEQLCRESDFISLHVPLTPQTRHLIGKEQFAWMKPSAILINTARGPSWTKRRSSTRCKRERSLPADWMCLKMNPGSRRVEDLPNAVLLPHIGSASLETRTKMGLLAAENAIAVILGKQPPLGSTERRRGTELEAGHLLTRLRSFTGLLAHSALICIRRSGVGLPGVILNPVRMT